MTDDQILDLINEFKSRKEVFNQLISNNRDNLYINANNEHFSNPNIKTNINVGKILDKQIKHSLFYHLTEDL